MKNRCGTCWRREAIILIQPRYRLCRPCAKRLGPEGRRAITRHDLGDDPAAFSAAVLRKLANGPIMQPDALYLPAGVISLAEAKQREAAAIISQSKVGSPMKGEG